MEKKEVRLKICLRHSGILAVRYNSWKMTLKELTRLKTEHILAKHPNFPPKGFPTTKPYTDKTANTLTRAIVDYIRLTGNYADRINNMGVYDARRGTYRKGGTRRGIADIMATKKIQHGDRTVGLTVAIEVKIGKDRLSEHQLAVKAEVERGGGVYLVAKDWDQFIRDWALI